MSTVAIEKFFGPNDDENVCHHGIGFDEHCEYCELEDDLEAQNQAEECSDMNVFHRY